MGTAVIAGLCVAAIGALVFAWARLFREGVSWEANKAHRWVALRDDVQELEPPTRLGELGGGSPSTIAFVELRDGEPVLLVGEGSTCRMVREDLSLARVWEPPGVAFEVQTWRRRGEPAALIARLAPTSVGSRIAGVICAQADGTMMWRWIAPFGEVSTVAVRYDSQGAFGAIVGRAGSILALDSDGTQVWEGPVRGPTYVLDTDTTAPGYVLRVGGAYALLQDIDAGSSGVAAGRTGITPARPEMPGSKETWAEFGMLYGADGGVRVVIAGLSGRQRVPEIFGVTRTKGREDVVWRRSLPERVRGFSKISLDGGRRGVVIVLESGAVELLDAEGATRLRGRVPLDAGVLDDGLSPSVVAGRWGASSVGVAVRTGVGVFVWRLAASRWASLIMD